MHVAVTVGIVVVDGMVHWWAVEKPLYQKEKQAFENR